VNDAVQRLDVEFSAVKEATEAQSGRFEFLKQALTLGSAGLAGFSIFFIEPDKIPDSLPIRIIILLAGLGLLFVTGAALSGIGSYANFLRRTETEASTAVTPAATTATGQTPKTAAYYRQNVVLHANSCLVGIFVSGLIITVFAGLRIFSPSQLGPEQALNRGRDIVKNQLIRPGQTYTLDSFSSDVDSYSVKYVLEPNHATYLIKLKKAGGGFDIVIP
jgi:hypothetical protein